jgi:hypothetical protein
MLFASPIFPETTMTPIERTRDYVESIELKRVRLVIMGKDLYPKSATGIAFCKPDWPALMAENCSGRYVLQALGINLTVEGASGQPPPHDLFKRLAQAGVVFLNASYSEDVGERFTKALKLGALRDAYYDLNKPILTAAKTVIRCGEARRMDWALDSKEEKRQFCDVVHPDKRNSYNSHTKVRWAQLWGTPGSLSKTWSGTTSSIALAK